MFVTLVEGISECELLADAVRRGPLAVDLDFPYHPHVTIAHHLDDDDRSTVPSTSSPDFECEFAARRVLPLRARRRRRLAAHAEFALRRSADLGCPLRSTASSSASRRPGAAAPSSTTSCATIEHYGDVNGSALAAAVTYFAFLSFFPILALAFAIFGVRSRRSTPNAEETWSRATNAVLPGHRRRRRTGVQPRLPAERGARGSSASASCSRSTPVWAGSRACAPPWSRSSRSPTGSSRASSMGKLRDITRPAGARLRPGGQRGRLRRRDQGADARSSTCSTSGRWAAESLAWVLGHRAWAWRPTRCSSSPSSTSSRIPNMPSQVAVVGGAARARSRSSCSSSCPPSCSRSPPSPTAFQAFGIALILVVWINYFSRVDRPCRRLGAHVACGPRPPRGPRRVSTRPSEGPRIDLAAVTADVRAEAAGVPTSPSPRAVLRRRGCRDARVRGRRTPPPAPLLSGEQSRSRHAKTRLTHR